MITTKNLLFSYPPDTAFDFPDIECKQGESLLITGGSGKGKTTLLHILAGLIRPHTGSVEINNTVITELSERQLDKYRGRNIGIVLQHSHFISSLSVLENITMASWLSSGHKASQKAEQLLEHLDIGEQMNKNPHKLSIGQQQRAPIARALINEPKVLLADEPTSSLDDENAEIVAALLERLSKEFNAALIIVTHDQRLKQRFSNSITL